MDPEQRTESARLALPLVGALSLGVLAATSAFGQSVVRGNMAGGGGEEVIRSITDFPLAPRPLGDVEVPMPDDLDVFVVDLAALEKLGKALFWDVRVGSDGLTACATCHYHAGANNRFKNTLAPGANGLFDATNTEGGGPNAVLKSGDFPLHRLVDPDEGGDVLLDVDDVVGATGVHLKQFDGHVPGNAAEMGTTIPDPTFQVGGVNVRQSTGRAAPSVLGAIFLSRAFHDGRANHFFNGVNPFGEQDSSARVLLSTNNGLVPVSIMLNHASAASQAVGPVLSTTEMSFVGRTWPDVGRKLLPMVPLAQQYVDPTDSVLGECANLAGNGLDPSITYADLVMDAIHPRWWNSAELSDGFTQMEKNFSLFFGLAIQGYEASLIPDQTPYDAFAAGDEFALTEQQKDGLDIFIDRGACLDCHAGSMFAGAMTPDLLAALAAGAEGEGVLERMAMENTGALAELEFSTHPLFPGVKLLDFEPRESIIEIYYPGDNQYPVGKSPLARGYLWADRSVACPAEDDVRVDFDVDASFPAEFEIEAGARLRIDGECGMDLGIELAWGGLGLGPEPGNYPVYVNFVKVGVLEMGEIVPRAVYDTGFYNIGVRPTEEDLGQGADGPFGPLSLSKRLMNGEDIPYPTGLDVPVGPDERVAMLGAFKTPTVRNAELTAPFMHNHGLLSLEQLVDFYSRGADFAEANIDDLDPAVSGIGGMDEERKAALVAFIRALTDPRVRNESAPFDHPELPLPHGHVGDTLAVLDDGSGSAVDLIDIIPATGAAGGPPIDDFESRLDATISVFPTEGLMTAEGAPEVMPYVMEPMDFNATQVRLDKQPTHDVSISVSLSDPAQAIVEPELLVFTSENWHIPQYVAVEAIDDGIADGDQTISILFSSASSIDPSYAGISVPGVEVMVADRGATLLLSEMEAEDGVLSGPMVVGADPVASNGAFIWAPPGTGFALPPNDLVPGSGSSGIAEFSFTVGPQMALEGPTRIWIRENAPSASADMFWAKVDDAPWSAWRMHRGTPGEPVWDLLNMNGYAVDFALAPGEHTLYLAHAKDGAMVDAVVFTNDPDFVPGNDVDPVDPNDL